MTRLVAAAAVVLAGAAAAWLWTPQSVSAGGAAADATSLPNPAVSITVHVSGAVAAPGLVELAPGSRVADAIAAAGGTLRQADLAQLNLAAPVRDGEQIRLPEATQGGPAAVAIVDGRVHVNRATPSELEALPGVGPVLAMRIADHRDQHGPFGEPEDLLDVPGIGEAKLAAMRDLVAIP